MLVWYLEEYFNTTFKEYEIIYLEETSDYITKVGFDGVHIILLWVNFRKKHRIIVILVFFVNFSASKYSWFVLNCFSQFPPHFCYKVCSYIKRWKKLVLGIQSFFITYLDIPKLKSLILKWLDPAGIYLLKINNRNTRLRCEICSKLTIETPEQSDKRRSGVLVVILNMFHTLT